MAKLILKGLIKKKWQNIYGMTNTYYVKDYNDEGQIKVRVIVDRNGLKVPYALLFGWLGRKAWFSVLGEIIPFDKYFLDWQNPTKNEIILFELETGLIYIDYYLGLRTWSYEE